MPLDRSGLEILDADQCRALLASAPVGRIVFTDRALPAVQPVNFALVDDEVVIRTSNGSKLAAAVRGAVVAFEADDFDAATRTGWSVVVVGHARLVTDPGELEELRRLPLTPWAPGEREQFVRIRPQMYSGRRIPVPSPDSADRTASL
ncbi:pyridoxamine 5'-phosphate oxidase family protein [Actinomadura keratinilytica]|jgi:nitroimidazol reductase NimA-like FMN-containing flavoprotein (pyridoxamine 5'-phosphate oxidase superfamily)|uniref:Pyridoxamine 5'-phosphate oxidase family protein n=1 Tax=Actinomadura keratinilytica TaxID=547461 RepID=A0ABP7Z4T2_9ACTN